MSRTSSRRWRHAWLAVLLLGTVLALLGAPIAGATGPDKRVASAGTGQYSPAEWLPLRTASGGGELRVGCTYKSPYAPQNICDDPATGAQEYHPYWALDLSVNQGSTIVYAAGAGQVHVGGIHSSYGNHVWIDHGTYGRSLYGHLATIGVTDGDWVDQNTPLGTVGHSGSTGGVDHLHYEYNDNSGGWGRTGSPNDPGQLKACHGSTTVTYPAIAGMSTWQGIQWGTVFVHSDGTGCETPPPPPDTDGDGVSDSEDRCPTEPGERPNLGCAVQTSAPVDVNGDGRIDVIHRWDLGVNTWISNGDGTYQIRGFQAHAGYGYAQGVWLTADVNGDGKTDLIHRWDLGVNTWISNGDGTYQIHGFQAHAGYGYAQGVWRIADVNGDGKTDLIHRWDLGVNTWISNGDGTYQVHGFQAHAGYGYAQGVWLTADVNGDGKTDLIHRWDLGVNTWISNGDGTYQIHGFQAHQGYGYAQGVWRIADVNGDGKTDLVHRWDLGVNTWISNGDGTYQIHGFQAPAGYGYAEGVWLTADVNGDGKTDLIHRWDLGVNTWISNGDGTYQIHGFQAHEGYGYAQGVWRIADVNGDGKTDLVHRWDLGVNTWISNGDGTYQIHGFQAPAGYGYAEGIWIDSQQGPTPMPPAAPTVTESTPFGGRVSVTFSSGSDGGRPITVFQASCVSTDGGTSLGATGAASPITVTGLTVAKHYHCRIRATNAIGTSRWSKYGDNILVPLTAPLAPTVTGSSPQASAVSVAFAPGADGGSPITSYLARCESTDGGTTKSTVGTTSPITVTGLSRGMSYHCRARATNAVGSSPYSGYGPTVTVPATAPAAPTVTGSTLQGFTVTVTFTPGTDGGSPVTSYLARCESTDGGTTESATGSTGPITVTGLSPGKSYRCRTRATNAVGSSPYSGYGPTVTVPATAPAAPTVTGSTFQGSTVTVTFTPGTDGGSPVTSYLARCESTDGGTTKSATGSTGPITVTGLSPGKSYRCRTRATNAIGASPYSGYGPTVTVPATAPAAPIVTGSTPQTSGVSVAFTPGADGGSPVTSYLARCESTDSGTTKSATGTTSPITVTGLSRGMSYHCRARATNAVGSSPYSGYGPTVTYAAWMNSLGSEGADVEHTVLLE